MKYLLKTSIVTFIAVVVALSSGCASILSGTSQKVNVTTTGNKKAQVSIDGTTHDVPAIINVKREDNDKVIKSKTEGCSDALLNKKINPIFFVNILSGGTFGSTTDYGTKAMWSYDDNVTVNCK